MLNEQNLSSTICQKVDDYDAPAKSLTGRTPEDIKIDTGIEKERLFPEDKRILYVGDPYQVMGKIIDNPNFTTIDYRFGEQVQFIYDEDHFRKNIVSGGESLARWVKDSLLNKYKDNYSEEHEELFARILPKLEQATQVAMEAPLVHDDPSGYKEKYEKVIEAWKEVKAIIAEERARLRKTIQEIELKDRIGSDEYGEQQYMKFVKHNLDDIWYTSENIIRGFRDIPDFYEKVWYPLYQSMQKEEQQQGRKFDDEEKNKYIKKNVRRFSDPLRLEKKTKESHVVQAKFPELPFKSETFDRFVASWSLSTHVFNQLNEQEFETCWDEIRRVLDENGEAFIFPLYYKDFQNKNKKTMVSSLEEYAKKNPDFVWELWDIFKNKIDDVKQAATLYLKKLPAKEAHDTLKH